MTLRAGGWRSDPVGPGDAPRATGAADPTGALARQAAPARRLTPSQAVVARPLLVVLPVLVLLVPSALLAIAREPVHSAEARVLVGGLDVEAQAVPGFVEASRTLAATYSRLVPTRAVTERVAHLLDVDVAEVAGHVDATSVPDSSLIRITGEGADEDAAVRYAAAAAQALEDYAADASGGPDPETLLADYRTARIAFNQASARRDVLDQQLAARASAGIATEADVEALSAAEADVDLARLESDTLAAAYGERRGRAIGSGHIDLVAPASYTGSDLRRTLQLAIAGPLLLGIIAGVALASLAANRHGVARNPGRAPLP